MLTDERKTRVMCTVHSFATQEHMERPKQILSLFVIIQSSEHKLLLKTKICIIAGLHYLPDKPTKEIIEEVDGALHNMTQDHALRLAGDLNYRLDVQNIKPTRAYTWKRKDCG